MLKLLFASLLTLGLSSSVATARSVQMPIKQVYAVVFAVEHKSKIGDESRWRFQLLSNGNWSYVTKTTTKAGKLSRAQVEKIQRLVRTRWNVTTHDVACLAFASEYTEYSVNGRKVWHDEMCSGTSLDRDSHKRLGQVMAIVRPLFSASA